MPDLRTKFSDIRVIGAAQPRLLSFNAVQSTAGCPMQAVLQVLEALPSKCQRLSRRIGRSWHSCANGNQGDRLATRAASRRR